MAAVPLGVVRDAVAGDAGDGLDDGLAAADDAVDQGRLAYVRPADHGNHRDRSGRGLFEKDVKLQREVTHGLTLLFKSPSTYVTTSSMPIPVVSTSIASVAWRSGSALRDESSLSRLARSAS